MNGLMAAGSAIGGWIMSNIVPISLVLLIIFGVGTATGTTMTAITTLGPALYSGVDKSCESNASKGTTVARKKIDGMPDGPSKDKYSSSLDKYGKASSSTSTTNNTGMEGQVEGCKLPLVMGDGVITWPLPGQAITHKYPCYTGVVASCNHNAVPKEHTGMDISGLKGTPVLAAVTGVVIETDDGWDDDFCQNNYAYNLSSCPNTGNFVKIKHSDGYVYWYHHLKKGSVIPKKGDKINAGTVIGLQGNSGWSLGYHLHLELRDDKNNLKDPLKYLHDNGCKNCPQ